MSSPYWYIYLLLFLLAITVLAVYTWWGKEEQRIAALHTPCLHDEECAGEQVCDSGRCRQPEGAVCAMDVDCSGSASCRHWKCDQQAETEPSPLLPRKKESKRVHWN